MTWIFWVLLWILFVGFCIRFFMITSQRDAEMDAKIHREYEDKLRRERKASHARKH